RRHGGALGPLLRRLAPPRGRVETLKAGHANPIEVERGAPAHLVVAGADSHPGPQREELRVSDNERPELVIGLVGPIGTPLDQVANRLDRQLRAMGYESSTIRVSQVVSDLVATDVPAGRSP